jgi:hypothetical protein
MLKLARVFEAITAIVLVLTWGFLDYVDANRPNHPTHKFNIKTVNHGQYIYISRIDNLIKTLGWSTFFVLCVISLVLEAWIQADRK